MPPGKIKRRTLGMGILMLRLLRELLPPKLRKALHERLLQRKARLRNEGFFCQALAGDSDYNITINSDLTVSCNCKDFDGSGHLGNLHSHSLEQIFAGPIAARFRKMLAERRFPTTVCARCDELRSLPSAEVHAALTQFSVPSKGIQIENTARCNLHCRMCQREQLLRLRSGSATLPLADLERISQTVKNHGIKSIRYYNLGEPFLSGTIKEELDTIRRHNPDIRIMTLTNGQLIQGTKKLEAALSMDYLGISIDGVTQETLSRYQAGGNFYTAFRNMKALIQERDRRGARAPVVEWVYVVFRWNDHPRHISRAIELAKEAKVDLIGFYRGDGPLLDRSRRWYYHPIFRRLGQKSNACVVVNLNAVPPHLLNS